MKTVKPLIPWGWLRAVIFLIITGGAGFSLIYLVAPVSAYARQLAGKSYQEFAAFFVTYFVFAVIVFAVTWLFVSVVDRRSFASLGFATKTYGNEAGLGFFIPIFLLCIGSLILIFTGNMSMSNPAFEPVSFLFQLLLMLVIAFVEEVLFRGYVLYNFLQSMNKWVALGISALVFAAFHITNPNITAIALVNVMLGGIILGLNYIFTRNLWYGMAFHFVWNFLQGPVLGYDVSGIKFPTIFSQTLTGAEFFTGGSFGFEGSFICSALLLIACIIMYVVFEKRYGNGSYAKERYKLNV